MQSFKFSHCLIYFILFLIKYFDILAYIVEGRLHIQAWLLKQVFIVKVLDERFVLRIVGIKDRLEFGDILNEFHPFGHSIIQLVFNWNSSVIVLVVFNYTIIAEKLLVFIFACYIVTDENLNPTTAVTLDVVRESPFVISRYIALLHCHVNEWLLLVTLNFVMFSIVIIIMNNNNP